MKKFRVVVLFCFTFIFFPISASEKPKIKIKEKRVDRVIYEFDLKSMKDEEKVRVATKALSFFNNYNYDYFNNCRWQENLKVAVISYPFLSKILKAVSDLKKKDAISEERAGFVYKMIEGNIRVPVEPLYLNLIKQRAQAHGHKISDENMEKSICQKYYKNMKKGLLSCSKCENFFKKNIKKEVNKTFNEYTKLLEDLHKYKNKKEKRKKPKKTVYFDYLGMIKKLEKRRPDLFMKDGRRA